MDSISTVAQLGFGKGAWQAPKRGRGVWKCSPEAVPSVIRGQSPLSTYHSFWTFSRGSNLPTFLKLGNARNQKKTSNICVVLPEVPLHNAPLNSPLT